jgi:P pilus assembly chaperone PapD
MKNIFTVNKLASCLVALVCLVSSATSWASLQFESMVVEINNPSFSLYDIPVKNVGSKKMFLTAKLYKVNNPGQRDEKRVAAKKVYLGSEVFFVSPKVNQKIQLLGQFGKMANNLKEDQIYRLVLTPNFAKPAAKAVKKGETAAGVEVKFSYDLLIVVRAPKPKTHLQYTRSGSQITIQNIGNTLATVKRIEACASTSKCQAVPGVFLYAGASQTFTIPAKHHRTAEVFFREHSGKISSAKLAKTDKLTKVKGEIVKS